MKLILGLLMLSLMVFSATVSESILNFVSVQANFLQRRLLALLKSCPKTLEALTINNDKILSR